MEKIRWFFLALLGGFLVITWQSWRQEELAKDRIRQEEVLLEEFLKQKNTKEPQDCSLETLKETEEPQESWSDDQWFTRDGMTYTPEYAKGRLDCILEIESIHLRRGVYIGSREEILHNLDVWMLTAARPDYHLGETHYCIYGHNCTGSGQEISMNRLPEVTVGDLFTLTTQDEVYRYQVTAVYGLGREEATYGLVDNFSLSADHCYLITCGREEYRYLDYIVEGVRVYG